VNRPSDGSAADAVRCLPPPEWVTHRPYADAVSADGVSAADDAYVDGGVLRVLYDSQTNVDEVGFSQHLRTVQRVITRSGAERAAHFAVEFDPTFQQVTLHVIRVHRSSLRIDHAKLDALQILRREKKLEQLALDGRLTAALLIPDLRIDDVLELSLTVTSKQPIIGTHYANSFAFNALTPWRECRHRLRVPLHREVFQKTFCGPPAAAVAQTEDTTESIWCLIRQPRLEREELTPPWQIEVPVIQFSEFRSWNQIAQLFTPYYVPSEMPPDLERELERIAQTFVDPADRAAEWLRFVQRHLRYFALSLGEGGLVPRTLETIWNRRFGDCKDGSRLYVAGAIRLGIDACAALTSTTHGRVLDQFIPSPAVFNHCIVRVRIDGKTYWLDPTMPRQEGRLAVVFQPHCGWALPLTLETESLASLDNDAPITYRQTEEVFQLGPKPSSPVSLSVRVHYHSFAADALRNKLENEGLSKLAEQVLNELRTTWPALAETAPLAIEDDPATNRLVAIFQYEIRDGWKPVDGRGRLGFKITAGSIAAELVPLKKVPRRTDVFLGRPRIATWKVRMCMPQRWAGNGWNTVLRAGGIRHINQFVIAGREIQLQREMVIGDWSVPNSQASAYQELVTKARENWVTIFGRVRLGRIRPAVGGIFALNRNIARKVLLLFWALYFLWLVFKGVTDKS